MKFYCWYNNGTGWYEGPYLEDHPDKETARKKTDIGYGAYVSKTNENPNVTYPQHKYHRVIR